MTQQPEPRPATQLARHLAHFQWRVLQDALTEATASYWEHRAQTLDEAARPRRGDYQGAIFQPDHPAYADASNRDRALAKADIAARRQQLTRDAAMCRFHAQLIRDTGLDAEAQTAISQVLSTGLEVA